MLILVMSHFGSLLIADDKESEKSIKPYIVLSGANSRFKKKDTMRIMTPGAWIKTWQKHLGYKEDVKYDLYRNRLKLPIVDFKTCMLIAVFGGKRFNSAGYKVHTIFLKDDNLIFRYEAKSYQTDGEGEKVTPYGFFIIPRSDKTVVGEYAYRERKNGPITWIESFTIKKEQSEK
ncbi:MAG: hypothetical protein HRT89_22795 [Lentisphaeria bacterium]|nr:hypothetical protein [Lentisphaeria bacterium]